MDTNILVFCVVLQVLQRDIETHGKIVCSVVKLCEKIVRADPSKGHYDTAHAYKVARSLERRWHFLYLRSLEWQCHLETLAGKLRNTVSTCHHFYCPESFLNCSQCLSICKLYVSKLCCDSHAFREIR